jgi:hypothetical protein
VRAAGEGRPSVTVVTREGDARAAVGVAVTTAGIASERGAVVAVALGALVEARLAERGVADARSVGGWDGWRLGVLAGTPADAERIAVATAAAMLAPVVADEPAMAAVASRIAALAQRPLPDRALADVARCTGDAYGMGADAVPSAGELEQWRKAAHSLGRVAMATAGSPAVADAVAAAIAKGPAWPAAAPMPPSPWPSTDARAAVYDASGQVAPGVARVVVTAWTALPERAVAAAEALGRPRGSLASRLAGLEAPARVRSVVGTAHADGGCVATTIDLGARDLVTDAPARIATAAALARQEVGVQIADTSAPPDLGRARAAEAADPREAAERAAWWSLARARGGVAAEDVRTALTVGFASPRDAAASPLPEMAEPIRGEIDRATIAWQAPVVEARTRVERGQGDVWVLIASACGTLSEAKADAGASAAVATAAAERADAEGAASGASVDAFVAADGVGVLAHGPPRPGETPVAHARRLADLAARAFAADALDADRIVHARTSLLARAADAEGRARGALAEALAPGHPSWVEPAGTNFGLASTTDEAVGQRASAMRGGPIRVAVVANADAAQGQAAVRAVDRWIARRPGDARACATAPALAAPHPGTYAVERSGGARSEALLAVPLPPDERSVTTARWIAAALDGADGLLAHALAGTDQLPSLAMEWSATVLGAPRSPALTVRLVAADASLDAAVAQTRGLLDRLRLGALREADRARAASSLARSQLASTLDPGARAVQLWRGEATAPAPSLEEMRAFAAASLRDDALVIVAARPPRLPPRPPPPPAARVSKRAPDG